MDSSSSCSYGHQHLTAAGAAHALRVRAALAGQLTPTHDAHAQANMCCHSRLHHIVCMSYEAPHAARHTRALKQGLLVRPPHASLPIRVQQTVRRKQSHNLCHDALCNHQCDCATVGGQTSRSQPELAEPRVTNQRADSTANGRRGERQLA